MNLNKKLLLAVLSFLTASSCLVTGTFAWYSLGSQVQLANIDIGIDASNELQIGFYNSRFNSFDFFDSLTEDDLVKYANFNPKEPLYPVSSMFQSDWLSDNPAEYQFLKPVLREQYKNSVGNYTRSAIAQSGYYSFTFYFLSAHDAYLYLDASTFFKADEEANAEMAEKIGVNVDDLNKIQNSLRVSILSEEKFVIYEPNVSESSKTKFGGRLNVLSYDDYYDYAPDNKEIMFGEYNEDDCTLIYDAAAKSTSVSNGISSFDAYSKDGIAPLDIERSISEGGLIIQEEKTYTLEALTDRSNLEMSLGYLAANEYHRVVVTVYVEGWDLDCTNLIKNSRFNANLAFTAKYDFGVEE